MSIGLLAGLLNADRTNQKKGTAALFFPFFPPQKDGQHHVFGTIATNVNKSAACKSVGVLISVTAVD